MTTIAVDEESVETQRAVAGGLRTFAIVAAGQMVSILGSSLTVFALGTWVYQETRSVTLLSMIILAASIPGVAIAPLAGSIVDRFDRRLVMLVSNSVICAAEVIMWAVIVTGRASLGYLYVLAAVSSLAAAFHEPAYLASVPLLVPKRHLGRASGFVQCGIGIAQIVAPGLAGILLVKAGIGTVLLADASTFLVAIVTLLIVQIPRPAESMEGNRNKGTLWRESAAGWRYLRDRPGLMGLLVLFAMVNFLVAWVNVLYIPLVLSFASPAVLGWTLTVGGSGVLVGSVVLMTLGTPKRKVRSILGLIGIGGVAIFMTGARSSAVWIASTGFVMMMTLPILQGVSQVLWQTKVVADLQGRVFALRRMLAQATLPAGIITAGWLADRVFEPLMKEGGLWASSVGAWIGVGPGRGIGAMFVLAGMAGCLLAVAGYLHPRIRHLEEELPDKIADTVPEASIPSKDEHQVAPIAQ